MGNDLFGGLGGLMKGLSGLMPQDDPNVKLMNAQGDLDGLKKQENELYVEIGKLAYQRDGAAAWPGQAEKLNLVQMNIAAATHCPTRLATADPGSPSRGSPSQPNTSVGHSSADTANPVTT